MNVIAETIVKRADALEVGDKILGTSKYEPTASVEWVIFDVRRKIDPILGPVVQVNVNVHAPEPEAQFVAESHEFFMRPYDRIHVQA
jgi:hypothetical protein